MDSPSISFTARILIDHSFSDQSPKEKWSKKKKHTLTRPKMRISKCWMAGWCFIEIDYSNHPTPQSLHFQRPQPWEGGLEGREWIEMYNSCVIQIVKKNIIGYQKSYSIWVQVPGLGVYLFKIDGSLNVWLYFWLYIYIYIIFNMSYTYLLGLHEPVENDSSC